MGYVLNTDFSGIAPSEGTRPQFPVSDSKGWLCMPVASEGKENSAKTGRILVITFQGLEGAVQGKMHEQSYNIANPNPDAVRIATEELSAIAHCTGHIRVGNSAEWHGKPMRLIIGLDTKNQDERPGSVRIAGYRDQHGNRPSEAGQGALTAGQNAGFGQPASGAVAGQPPAGQFQQGQPAGFGGNPQQQQGQPAAGWQDPNAGQGQPQQQQQGQFQPQQQGVGFQGQPQGDPNMTQAYQTGQFNPNAQQQGQGQPQQNGGFQAGGAGQPSWA